MWKVTSREIGVGILARSMIKRQRRVVVIIVKLLAPLDRSDLIFIVGGVVIAGDARFRMLRRPHEARVIVCAVHTIWPPLVPAYVGEGLQLETIKHSRASRRIALTMLDPVCDELKHFRFQLDAR